MTAITDLQRVTAMHRAQHLGYRHVPYVFGGAKPNALDCSGLAMLAWKAGDVELPHNTIAMRQSERVTYVKATKAAAARLQLGDLVFFPGVDQSGRPGTFEQPHHVAVYVGEFDDMRLIAQATDTELGSEVIRMDKYGPPLAFGYVA